MGYSWLAIVDLNEKAFRLDFLWKGGEQAANTSIHSELKIAQLFVLLVRPKLVIKFIERKTLFFNPQDQIRNSPL